MTGLFSGYLEYFYCPFMVHFFAIAWKQWWPPWKRWRQSIAVQLKITFLINHLFQFYSSQPELFSWGKYRVCKIVMSSSTEMGLVKGCVSNFEFLCVYNTFRGFLEPILKRSKCRHVALFLETSVQQKSCIERGNRKYI